MKHPYMGNVDPSSMATWSLTYTFFLAKHGKLIVSSLLAPQSSKSAMLGWFHNANKLIYVGSADVGPEVPNNPPNPRS